MTELVEISPDENIIAQTATSGIPEITESGETPPPADDGSRAETQEEFEIIDDDDQLILQKDIIVQEEIIVQDKTMEPEMEAFVESLLQEVDVMCPVCKGTGKYYFHDDCTLCDGVGKLFDHGDESRQHVDELEAVYAIGDKKPERRGTTDGDWQKIRITLDSGSGG